MNEDELKRLESITENKRLNCTESAFEPLKTDGEYFFNCNYFSNIGNNSIASSSIVR